MRSDPESDCLSGEPPLTIDRAALRLAARRYGPPGHLLAVLWRQRRAERLWRRTGRHFRSSANERVCQAYREMDDTTFCDINARQAWANWRTIPRSIDRRLPDRPLRVLDLCCGTGDSTAVLAWCCPPGSHILGLDISPSFIRHARQRRFHDRNDDRAATTFQIQSVLEPFCHPDGNPVAAASIDLINASGAVGCHFDAAASATLAQLCADTVRPDGLATIDAGHAGTPPDQLRAIFIAAGFTREHETRSSPFDRYRHLCFRRTATAPE